MDQWATGLIRKNGESQGVYSCFITGFEQKPSYIIQTRPNVTEQLKQLDGAKQTKILLAITNT